MPKKHAICFYIIPQAKNVAYIFKGLQRKKIEEEYTVEYTCNPAKLAAIVFLVPCSKNLSTPVVEYLGERL